MSDTTKPYWDIEWQDTANMKSGHIRVADYTLAFCAAYAEWRETDYRHVRLVTHDLRIVLQYFPRKGIR